MINSAFATRQTEIGNIQQTSHTKACLNTKFLPPQNNGGNYGPIPTQIILKH